MAARRAELLGGVLADFPAAVAAKDPGLENGDTRKGGVEKVQVDAQGDVAHGHVGGDEGCLERLLEGLGGDVGGFAGLDLFDVCGGCSKLVSNWW